MYQFVATLSPLLTHCVHQTRLHSSRLFHISIMFSVAACLHGFEWGETCNSVSYLRQTSLMEEVKLKCKTEHLICAFSIQLYCDSIMKEKACDACDGLFLSSLSLFILSDLGTTLVGLILKPIGVYWGCKSWSKPVTHIWITKGSEMSWNRLIDVCFNNGALWQRGGRYVLLAGSIHCSFVHSKKMENIASLVL